MKDKLRTLIGLEVKENEPLKNHTTFKIGGPAKFFVEVQSKDELFKSLKAARELNLKYLILGGGSNVLVSDDGFDGLVIKLNNNEIEIKGSQVTVFAGNNLKNTINQAMKENLGGLEFAANIPGTVGGAVRGNAGAYGKGVGDYVEQVEVIVLGEKEVSLKVLTKDDCEFDYRESLFKKNENWIISEVVLVLESKSQEDIQKEQESIDADWKKRCGSQPYDTPSAGCTFKNIIYTDELLKYKDWETHGKVPAGRFIEEADLKGKKIGGAMVSEKHSNFIVNFDNATADDVVQLISFVKTRVRDEFGVQLQEEVQYIGF
ncbi:UDP-N-acetylmuramate dehydrogenase [Candidatus Falkowbacteria bacterium]|jgi:UDP-N-acetylmuramate dehydrogenase|nr:UDP-N-acetylmuramate dehydrogenase [Candidatus Falkowbacteria bacterium]MBT7007221.1 UDP-N-acetylmuramate dehydrogenase [Candidatus Falkowbacteria bacterium]